MSTPPSTSTPPAAVRSPAASRRAQGLLVLGVLVAVVAVDQATKWWAWRNVPALINYGSTWFFGGAISRWCASAWNGALLDVAGTQVLAVALFALLRRRRPPGLLVPVLLVIAGWGSNLLDRLGLHLLTAPGMGRGAVDFIRFGSCYYNLADLCIVAGTVLLGLDLYRRARRSGVGAAGRGPGAAVPRPWRGLWRWALLAALVPAVLGTAVTLTASGGQATAAETPLVQLLQDG